jgi:CheY-like chemotaxis protein
MPSFPGSNGGKPTRVLIVDDSIAVQHIVRRSVRRLGIDNLEDKIAGSGEEALELIRSWQPDLVLSDWHMPQMSGLELLYTINKEMISVDFGFITTETSRRNQEKAVAAGAKFIVNKPFDIETLRTTLLPILVPEARDEPTIIMEDEADTFESLGLALSLMTEKEIELVESERVNSSALGFPLVIGFFNEPGKANIKGICLLDLGAACVLGGAVISEDDGVVQHAISTGQLPHKFYVSCQEALPAMAQSFADKVNLKNHNIGLNRVNMMKKPSAKLHDILDGKKSDRQDLTISAPGYGKGHIILITT